MYRARSKRARRIRFLMTYTLVPVIVVCIVTALVFYSLGYRFNSEGRNVVQGGLMQFDSYPGGASVRVGNKKLSWPNTGRLNTPPGMYTVTMQKNGYTPWQKTVFMSSGSVLRLNYARLFPIEIKSKDVLSLEGNALSLSSYRKDTIVFLPDRSLPSIQLATQLSGTPKLSTIEIPKDILRLDNQTDMQDEYELVELSKDARNVLIQHSRGDQSEVLLLDTDNSEQSINVTRLFEDTGLAEVFFDSDDSNRFYVLDNEKSLYRLSLSNQSTEDPIAKFVETVRMNPQGLVSIVYSAEAGSLAERGAFIMPDESSARTLNFSESDQQSVDVASDDSAVTDQTVEEIIVGRYLQTDYVAAVRDGSLQILPFNRSTGVVKSIDDSTASEIELAAGYDKIEFSPTRRFVMVYSGTSMRSYDLELDKLTASTLASSDSAKHGWLDGFNLWTNDSGKLAVKEFDGENNHEIGSIAPGAAVVLAENQEAIYSVRHQDGKTFLVRFNMLTED